MEWTTEPPTQTGLYWAFNEHMTIDGVDAVDVYGSNNSLLVAFELGDNYDTMQSLSRWTHWMGPLSVPEPPTK